MLIRNFTRLSCLFFVFFLYFQQTFAQCSAEITPSGPTTFCQGGSVRLTASAGASFQWFEDGKVDPISTAPFIDVNTSGKFSVKVVSATPATCPESTSPLIEVVVNALPTSPDIVIIPSATECAGTGFNFKVNNPQSGVVYSWEFGDGGLSNGVNVGHTFPITGANASYTILVRATVSATGCTISSSKVVAVKSTPKIVISNDFDFKRCLLGTDARTSISFVFYNESVSSNPTTYKWSWGDGTADIITTTKDPQTHTYNGYNVYNLTITATDNITGCTSSISKKVTFQKYPSASLHIPAEQISICEGKTITISNNSTNATSYIWDWGDGTTTSTTSKDPQSHIYTLPEEQICRATGQGVEMIVTLYAINDCQTHTNTSPIYVLPKPKPKFSVLQDKFCLTNNASTSTVSFTNLSCPSDPSYADVLEYSWDFGDPASGSLNKSDRKNPLPHYYAQPGIYTITLTAKNSCGEETYTKSIQIDSPPTANFSIPTSICANSDLATSNTSSGFGISYQWSISTTNFSYSANTSSTSKDPVFKFTQPGTYNITLTITNTCNTTTLTKAVIIKDIPSISLPAPIALCGAQTVTYGNSSDNQAIVFNGRNGSNITFIWSITGTSGATFTGGTTSISQFPQINFPSSGIYTVTVKATNECGSSSTASQNITIYPPPTDPITADVNICINQTATLVASGSNGSYRWFTTATGGSPIGTNPTYTTGSLTSNTTYYVEAINSQNCLSARLPVQVTVTPLITNNSISANQTICTNTSPNLLIGTTPTGGGSISYLWEYSINNGSSFNAAPGINSEKDYNPGILTQTTLFRRKVISPTCPPSFSNPITIIIEQNISGNDISADQIICSGTVAGTLNPSTSLSGGAGTYTYQWQSSTDNSNFINVTTSGTAATYNPGTLTQTTYFRRIARSGVCAQSISNVITVTVNQLPTVTASNPAPVCAGQTATFTANVSSGITRWYTVASGGSPIHTGNSFTTPALANNTTVNLIQDYYVDAFASNCTSLTRTKVTVTVKPTPVATATPATATICTGNPLSIALTSNVAGTTFSWTQTSSAPTITGASDGSGAAIAQTLFNTGSGPGTVIYTITPMANGCPGLPITVSISVNPVIQNNTLTGEQSLCSGQTAMALTGTNPTGGAGNYSYVWEKSTTSATTGFTAIANTNTLNYSPGALTTNTWYRRKVSSGSCEDISTAIKVTVYSPISNNTITAPQTICSGSTPAPLTGSMPANGSGTYTYLWESSTNGTNFNATSGSNTDQNYTPSALSQSTWFRRVVTSDKCSDISPSIKITVDQPIAGNTISGDQTICKGTPANTLIQSTAIVLSGGGASGFSYQWQSSTDNSTFTNITIAGTAATYNPGALTQTTYFKRIVRSGVCAESESNVITITVNPIPTVTTNNPAPICAGETATLTATVSDGIARWYTVATGGSDIHTGNTYTIPVLNNNTAAPATYDYYVDVIALGCVSPTRTRVSVTVKPTPVATATPTTSTICTGSPISIALSSTVAGTTYTWTHISSAPTVTGAVDGSGAAISQTLVNSGTSPGTVTYTITPTAAGCTGQPITVTITVNPVIQDNTIRGEQSICSGQIPVALTGSVSSGGSGSFTYVWEKSTSSATTGFTAIANATSINYAPGSLLGSTWYRRKVISGNCEDTSTPVKITVYPTITNNTISAPQTICSGSVPAILKNTAGGPAGGNDTYTYLWQSSTDNISFIDAIGTNTSADYNPGALSQTTWFRRLVTSDKCTNESVNIKITVDQPIVGNTIAGDQTICESTVAGPLSSATLLSGGGAGVYTYQWQSSTDNSIFTNITTSGTSATYSPSILIQTTYFKRIVRSGTCAQSESNVITITVNPRPTISASNPAAICAGETATLTATVSSGTAKWYTANGTFLAEGLTYITPSLPNSTANNTTYDYLVEAVALGCVSSTKARVTVTVKPTPVATATPATANICTGNPLSIALASNVAGTTFNWTQTSSAPTVTGASDGLGATIAQTLINAGTAPATVTYSITPTAAGCIGLPITVSITVNPVIQNNTLTGEQSLCSGQTAMALTGTNPTGGGGSYSYMWEKSTTSATTGFTTIAGANNIDYSPGALTTNTWYRRKVRSGSCEDISSAIKVTVYSPITNNTITAPQTICSGSSPATLTGSMPTNGSGSYTYLWESSTNGTNFNAASGSNTDQNYTPSALSQSTWFRRVVNSDKCSDISPSIKITVDQTIAGNNISGDQTICKGTTANTLTQTSAIVLSGGGASGFSYQWQSSTDNSTFTNIPTSGTAATYNPGALTQTTYFKRIVRSGVCAQSISNVITITINPIPTVTTSNPAPICAGETATLTATVSDGIARWYTVATGGSAIHTGNTYTTPVLNNNTAAPATYDYYVDVIALECVSPSRTKVTVTVKPSPVATATPATTTICTGSPISIALSSTVAGTTYTWTHINSAPTVTGAIDGSGAVISQTLVNSGTSPGTVTYTITPTAAGCTGQPITVTITVNPVILNNTITGDQSVCSGQAPVALTGSAPTGGSGSFTYVWESSTYSATTGFTAIANSNTKDFAPGALTSTTWYRRKLISATCENISSAVQVTVYPTITNNFISGSQTICTGSEPAILTNTAGSPAGGNDTYTYIWQISTNGSTFTSAPGINTDPDYKAGPLTQTTWFRRLVTSDKCTNTSTSIIITVEQNLAGNIIAGDQTICQGEAANDLIQETGTVISGGDLINPYQYQWQHSTDNITFTDIINGTSASFTPGTVSQTTYYKRIVRSGVCAQSESNVITITVNPIPTVSAVDPDPICASQTATLTATVSSGTARWYTTATGGSPVHTGNTYTSTALSNTSSSNIMREYYVEAEALGCVSPVRTKVTVTVKPTPVAVATPTAQTICTGTAFTIDLSAVVTGTTFSWGPTGTTNGITGASSGSGNRISQTLVNAGATPATVTYTITPMAAGCTGQPISVTITVNPDIQDNHIDGTQTICSGQTPVALPGSVPSGGSGIYTYAWESSTDGNNFTAAPGMATNAGYTPGALTVDTWYRRIVFSGNCQLTSNEIKITATPLLANNTIAQVESICTGTSPEIIRGTRPTGGNGTYEFIWSKSYDNIDFILIPSENEQDLNPGILLQSTYFRRTVQSEACTQNSNIILITVNERITNNSITSEQIICEEATPLPLSGSIPQGGNHNYIYRWEKSEDNISYVAISNSNSQDYAPGPLTKTTWFRRVVSAGPCDPVTSNPVKITVNPSLRNNLISRDQTICTGTAPVALTGSMPTGGDGDYTYLWESSITSAAAGFSTAAGEANQLNYAPNTLTRTTWYRRSITSGGCTLISSIIEITVNDPIANNAVLTPPTTICAGSSGPLLNGSAPSGGNNNYLFEWQYSTLNKDDGFQAAPGLYTTEDYSPGVLTRTTWFRRIVTAGPCQISTSETIQITVNDPISQNSITTPQEICIGNTPVPLTGSIPQGGNGNYQFIWEYSTSSASTGFAPAPGVNNGQNYVPDALFTSTWFRRKVVSPPCLPDFSEPILIEVTPAITNNMVPANQVVCEGVAAAEIIGSNPTGGNGTFSYLWQSSTDSIHYETAAGINNRKDYAPPVLFANTWFRRIVLSGSCTNISAQARITVNKILGNNIIRTDQAVCVGGIPDLLTGTIPTGGNGKYQYLWETSTNGLHFVAATGANTSADYDPGSMLTTTWFRRIVTAGPCDPSISPEVKITVNPPIDNNSISKAQRLCKGTLAAPLTGTNPTGGDGTYTYIWEISTTGPNSGYQEASGTTATAATYYPGYLFQTTWIRRTAFSGGCTHTSRPVQILVDTEITDNTIAPAQTICYGSSPTVIAGSTPKGGNGTYLYFWEISSDGTNFTPAPNLNSSKDYKPSLLIATTWFRRTVSSMPCNTLESNILEIKVLSLISENTISASQSICFNTAPAMLTGSYPAGGSGNYTYLWESSTTSASTGFSPAPGKNNESNYSPAALTQTSWFRRIVYSDPCNALVSGPIEIKVKPLTPTPKVQDVSICPGLTATLTASGPADSYEWYDASENGNLVFTGTTFTTPALRETTTYYVQSIIDGCAGGRQPVKVYVYDFKADAGPDVFISRGESVMLKATGGVKYSWSPAETLRDSTTAMTLATPKETTTYKVKVTSAEGCEGTDEVTVTIIPNIVVSGGLTPNGDGFNDTWIIQNIEYYPEAIIEIYNRWGNRVFHSKGYLQTWDGKFNGKDLPMAAYYYIIKLGKNKTPISGSITIAR